MRADSILREMWRIKDENAAKYGYDVRALGKALQKEQLRRGGKLVSRCRKRRTPSEDRWPDTTLERRMAMPFKMDCPHCGKTLNVVEKAYGKTLPCPGCNRPVAVPTPPESPSTSRAIEQCASPRVSQHAPETVASPPPLAADAPMSEQFSTESRVCDRCSEQMPTNAVRCPKCTSWRKDIRDDRIRLVSGLMSGMVFGVIAVVGVREGWEPPRTLNVGQPTRRGVSGSTIRAHRPISTSDDKLPGLLSKRL